MTREHEMIDFSKPVQTRDGRKVRILCTDMKGDMGDTVVGIIAEGDSEEVLTWKTDGVYNRAGDETSCDLINVPETRVVWVNMYAHDLSTSYPSKVHADRHGAPNREACIRVEYTVGQFDE